MSSPRVLVVDDEPQMLEIVAFALETQGFECATAPDAETAWRMLNSERFDLAVLDVTLPGASGVTLCRRIRSRGDLPVLLLTARGETDERVEGLEAGADDYVLKPFSPRELALRCQGLLRRVASTRGAEVLRNGPLLVDVAVREVTYGERRIHLTDVELGVLAALARRPGVVVGWRELLNEVWSTTAPHGGRQMIKTAVYRLRSRLHAEGGDDASALVESVRGAGYMMPRLAEGSVTEV